MPVRLPSFDEDLGFSQCVEILSLEELVMQPRAQPLDVAIPLKGAKLRNPRIQIRKQDPPRVTFAPLGVACPTNPISRSQPRARPCSGLVTLKAPTTCIRNLDRVPFILAKAPAHDAPTSQLPEPVRAFTGSSGKNMPDETESTPTGLHPRKPRLSVKTTVISFDEKERADCIRATTQIVHRPLAGHLPV